MGRGPPDVSRAQDFGNEEQLLYELSVYANVAKARGEMKAYRAAQRLIKMLLEDE